jgi:hypothetical protein
MFSPRLLIGNHVEGGPPICFTSPRDLVGWMGKTSLVFRVRQHAAVTNEVVLLRRDDVMAPLVYMGPRQEKETQSGRIGGLPIDSLSRAPTDSTTGDGSQRRTRTPADSVSRQRYSTAGFNKGSPLARNLVAAGATCQRGDQAHHIVAKRARRADPARAALQRVGIDIDNAANGVFLPSERSDLRTAANHRRVHTKKYYEAVNKLLVNVQTSDEAVEVLSTIRELLLSGQFPKE